ncbi:uncharacterized protein SOCEGT47_008030 [Sorangium cellulosum]|uniref:Uncharacterized protein n=1 Tax=Sorangium cellulosum TaxID=56 RepID=A0A4P2PUA4_SORCE|nr:hypothetical protein [Sorangium cellulosum]AUX20335.1 uncharacterized protein SOCEGT47_008030 [Sorangium cellulosum]
MRFVNPYPCGHPPRNEDLRSVLVKAVRGEIVDGDDRVLTELDRAALKTLGPALEIREDRPCFDERCRGPLGLPQLGLLLSGEAGPVGRLDLYPENRSIYWRGLDWKQWGGWSELRDGRALLELLAAHGIPAPLEDVTRWHGEEGERVRREWIKAIPPNLKGPWCASADRLLDPWHMLEAATWVGQAGASLRKARGLLEWYGAASGPFARRPDHELLPRLLLGRFLGEDLRRALQPQPSDPALAGAGRHLLDAGPLSPSARAQLVEPLDARLREAIVDAVRRRASGADADRLRARLFPAPFVPPEPTTLVGASSTLRLRRPVAAGDAVYAVDFQDIVRLEGGARSVVGKLLSDAVLAVRGGRLLVGKGGGVQELDARGNVVAVHPAATPEQAAAARAVAAAWSAPAAAPALGEPLGPTPDERDAFEALAHLGLGAPPSARAVGRDHLEAGGRAVVRRGEAGAPPRRIALPGRAMLHASSASHLALALDAGDACQIAWVEEGTDALRLSPPLRIAPRALRFLLATGAAALLGVDLGAGEVVLRVGLERAGGRPGRP